MQYLIRSDPRASERIVDIAFSAMVVNIYRDCGFGLTGNGTDNKVENGDGRRAGPIEPAVGMLICLIQAFYKALLLL